VLVLQLTGRLVPDSGGGAGGGAGAWGRRGRTGGPCRAYRTRRTRRRRRRRRLLPHEVPRHRRHYHRPHIRMQTRPGQLLLVAG
jgi:hypothetical protein